MRERRSIRAGEVQASGDGRTFEAVVCVYNVVDDYNTRFRPGCFTASLQQRLPRVVWAHQWSEPLGRYVDYRDTPTELTLIGEFDDFDAVPQAKRAYAQLMSGTIDQFSVGFSRLADEPAPEDEGLRGVTDITLCDLDEASLVLAGAVPGTRLLSVRAGAQIPADVAAALLAQLGAGSIDLEDALRQAREAATASTPAATEEEAAGDVEPEPEPEADPVEMAALDAEMEAALAVLTERSR